MITLNDVLASSRLQGNGAVSNIGQEIAASAARRALFETFRESQEREQMNAERSPVVLWAKKNLRDNRLRMHSKMTDVAPDQPRDSSW